MIRIRFTAADFAMVRLAPRPAPLQELNTALLQMCHPGDDLLFGRWRRKLLRSLPTAAGPLADLVPGAAAPAFLDVFADSLTEGLTAVRSGHPTLVRAEIERVYAGAPGPAPLWVRGLHRGDDDAWRLLQRAQRAAFETALRPVWPLVQDLHQAEFTRHALTVAEHGTGAALTALVPGSRLEGEVWECPGPGTAGERELRGRGLVLQPTFHWTGHPLIADPPDGPLFLTYPAGPGLPLPPGGADGPDGALAEVLGRTRLGILLALADAHTTSGLARRLGVGNATVSAHTAALRGAGLLTTVRAGRAVLHRRTALGGLLVRRHSGAAAPELRSTPPARP
ncbi:ArsR/SmtB family transcription factor [Streptomyces sp. NPDC056411]|uniref:ArsR/SmtB family transcription factor n=1 Tax=Streptomyces sp. NPDC056411 TaxID=3345813 RepID=UPI0035D9FD70